jgi:hypothetical protein
MRIMGGNFDSADKNVTKLCFEASSSEVYDLVDDILACASNRACASDCEKKKSSVGKTRRQSCRTACTGLRRG